MFNVPGEAIESYGTAPKVADTSVVSMRITKERPNGKVAPFVPPALCTVGSVVLFTNLKLQEVRSSRLVDPTVTDPLWTRERETPIYGDGNVAQTPNRGHIKTKMNQIIGFLRSVDRSRIVSHRVGYVLDMNSTISMSYQTFSVPSRLQLNRRAPEWTERFALFFFSENRCGWRESCGLAFGFSMNTIVCCFFRCARWPRSSCNSQANREVELRSRLGR